MRLVAVTCCAVAGLLSAAHGADDLFDLLDEALSASTSGGAARAHLSGACDLTAYQFAQPPPSLIYTEGHTLFAPRLSLFLDAQWGPRVYAFAEASADRGFDPHNGTFRPRLDEYALRLTPWADGRFNLQIGKFSTVVGTWAPRHDSWDNPFITAPLPYENLTGVWDIAAPHSTNVLLIWANAGPNAMAKSEFPNKDRSVPIIWGPSYATGGAVSGQLGNFSYAAEVKNSSLSSRPDSWDADQSGWGHPTVSGRLSYQPDESWNFGVSASTGTYLQTGARPTLAPGAGLGDYREIVVGQDISYAWHHLQVWAEVYEARFQIPQVDNFETVAYYVEAKVKFTPQFFGAVRWNQQLFANVLRGAGQSSPWGNDAWRADFGPGYRFTAHTQLKLQYSLQHEEGPGPALTNLFAAQFTVRF